MLFVLPLILLLAACQLGERPESSFANYQEAAASGMIERGWIPDWLPETAVNIQERHDLDTNASILFFSAGAEFSTPEGCEPTSNPPAAAFKESWWPQSFSTDWPVYDCGSGHLSVDEIRMSVYFWRP
jgi:hypothetical protein